MIALFQDICCQCGERLQNSEELGIHLCDGGSQVILDNREPTGDTTEKTNEEKVEEEVDARLGMPVNLLIFVTKISRQILNKYVLNSYSYVISFKNPSTLL